MMTPMTAMTPPPIPATSSSPGADAALVSTLANGMAVVEELAAGARSVRELTEAVGLNRQTTYRLLRTLVARGWAVRDVETDRYALGPRLFGLVAEQISLNDSAVRDALSPALRDLAAVTGETMHLAIYDGGEVVYIDKADGLHPIRSYTKLGGRAPAYCVATGKTLLAFQHDQERRRVLFGELVAHTPQTFTDPRLLERELAEIVATGVGYNRAEWREGVGGIALPVIDRMGRVVAAFGISGPVDRVLDNAVDSVGLMRAAVERAGFTSTPFATSTSLGRGHDAR